MTRGLTDAEVRRLHKATRATLADWNERLRAETSEGIPERVTALRKGMSVHSGFSEPCPDCGALERCIRYTTNETNYCARCNTAELLK